MARRLVVLGLCVALQAGAFRAPLVHTHLDDRDADHHHGQRLHAHLGGHHGEAHHQAADAPALHSEESPDRVAYLQVFVAAHGPAVAPLELPTALFEIARPVESAMGRAPDVVRSHGPPGGRPSASRAPPARSVLI